MIKASELNKETREDLIQKEFEKTMKYIEEMIIRMNDIGERSFSTSVERNGWFKLNEDNGITWGDIIADVMDELVSNGYGVRLYDSIGTVSYTKTLKIYW